MKNTIYVYLAKRDKKGIKVIASFGYNNKCYPTKINFSELSKTQLPARVQQTIRAEKDILSYEIYIESASSADEFRKSLISRGYRNVPLHQISISNQNKFKINNNFITTEESLMMKRNSQARRT